jgi:tetratricopeptide (TPR) repeat protein
MRQVHVQKSNVAWFTLAECVSRGEKERALGVYRLLSHSLDDSAVIAQLEGDLLWAFNDKAAIEKYYSAATCYQQDGRYREAFAVLEHCRALSGTSRYCLEQLIQLAEHIHHEVRLSEYIREYIDRVDDLDAYLFVRAVLEKPCRSENAGQFFMLKVALAIRVSAVKAVSSEEVLPFLREIAAACLVARDEHQLQRLLVSLEHNNVFYYQQIVSYLAESR